MVEANKKPALIVGAGALFYLACCLVIYLLFRHFNLSNLVAFPLTLAIALGAPYAIFKTLPKPEKPMTETY